MRKIGLILFVFLMSSLHLHAEDQGLFIEAVEYEKIIVNWNPHGDQLARVIAYECLECDVKYLVVNRDTQLENEDGQALDISELSKKVDWGGTIQIVRNNPNIVFKIMLH